MVSPAFYACLDIGCSALVTQAIQHLVIGDMAARLGGRVTFYTSEDPATLRSQGSLRAKLAQRPAMDGLIFFRLGQFRHGTEFDYPLLRHMLSEGYSVHFARERLSLPDVAALTEAFPTLYLADHAAGLDLGTTGGG